MRRILAALLGCLLTVTAGWAADVDAIANSAIAPAPSVASDLPDLGGPANAMISKFDESQIGRMEMNELRDQNMILEDPEVTDYLQQLGSRLSSQARVDDQTFTYLALREPIVNAFATFGGFICINSGLILLTNDEAELASVMAHETGHVVQRHMARAVQAESRMSLASTAALLAAVLIGAASGAGGQAIEGAIAMSQGIALQQSINFTRSQEIEADAVGIQLLAGAGFDPQEMATFFESLSRSEGLAEGEIPALLQDHPVTSDRIATARARAAQMTRATPQPESVSYSFIKERVRVLVTPPEARPAQYYANLREHRTLTPAERYGEALLQMQDGKAAQAVRTLSELQATYPQLTMLYAALGQALAADGQTDAALSWFDRSDRLFPRNVPITVRYAETLMQTGHAKQAHEILLDLFNNVDPSPPQIRLTALAASAAGDPGDAYYYMAQYDLAGGNLPLANQQLELALASPNISAIQRARFRAQLDEVRGWLREQQAAHRSTGGR
ncbi:MAG TPA: M48 family metalloprotease [Steroidobacteraceae bacterium]